MKLARRFGFVMVVTCVVAAAATSVAQAKVKPTGPLKKVCATAFVGQSGQSQACAILWYDASTKQISARCTVEYSFSGVVTQVLACDLYQGRKKTFERVVEAYTGGEQYTDEANRVYMFETAGAEPSRKYTYSAFFDFQPSLLGTAGEQERFSTPFTHG